MVSPLGELGHPFHAVSMLSQSLSLISLKTLRVITLQSIHPLRPDVLGSGESSRESSYHFSSI